MPRQPPTRTRKVGISTREPAILAPTTPAHVRPTIVKIRMERDILPTLGAKTARKGTNPPRANEIAEAIDA
jgi:hypothetical protein